MAGKVVNVNAERYDVYIGRPHPGQEWAWGNPFEIGRDGTRAEVIEKFKEFFLASDDERALWMRENISTLSGKTLGCWCKPKACHGDFLCQQADLSKSMI